MGSLDVGHGVRGSVGVSVALGEGHEAPGHEGHGEGCGHGHLQVACRASVQPAASQIIAVRPCMHATMKKAHCSLLREVMLEGSTAHACHVRQS